VSVIVNCRIDDAVTHTVIWKSRVSGSMFRMEEKEKSFSNFMDASGFAAGLRKRGIVVEAIIPFRHTPFSYDGE
jgi:hypothetical protein